jgi:simple sugar transport system permease protein
MSALERVRRRGADLDLDRRGQAAVASGVAFAALTALGLLFPGTIAGTLVDVIFSSGTLSSALRLSVPIVLAALGGIFAEKSGVINIGLEGLLIISAFGAIYAMDLTDSLWIGFGAGVFVSTLLAALFAVVCIEFRADQIIAGLAVWLIALGLAPFASQVIYGAPNTTSVRTPPSAADVVHGLPVVGDVLRVLASAATGFGAAVVTVATGLRNATGGVPLAGLLVEAVVTVAGAVHYVVVVVLVGALVEANVVVYLTFLMVALSWYGLYRTQFGRWVRASGENPRALDTAGVDVSRVRYAAVLLSGVLSGMGGSALSLTLGQFTGNGPTMVNGKGFIAIVAYLFGNYNPVGAFLSTLLFAGLDALQIVLQLRDVGVPNQLIRVTPFVMVIVVLALVGRTQIPSAAGEHYESGEE